MERSDEPNNAAATSVIGRVRTVGDDAAEDDDRSRPGDFALKIVLGIVALVIMLGALIIIISLSLHVGG